MYNANPYAAPISNMQAPAVAHAVVEEFPAVVTEPLRATRPWARFLSILGFISTGLMVVAGLAMMVIANDKLPPWMGAVYLILAVLYVPPSLFLYRYASAIEVFLSVPSFETLGEALRQQKSFWRLIGIAMAAILLLYVVAIAFGIVAAILMKK